MATSILIRTFVADGERLTPPRRRRDHLAQRPGRGVGRDGREGARPARRDRRPRGRVTRRGRATLAGRHVWIDGALAARRRAATCPRSIAASSSATASSRRCAPAAAARPSSPSTSPASAARRRAWTSTLPADARGATSRAGIAALLAAEGLDGPDGDASIRITVSRGAIVGRGLLPARAADRRRSSIQAWPVPPPPADHLERGLHLVVSAVRRDPANPLAALKTTSRADYVYARLEARRAGADDALFLTIDGHLSEATSANIFLVRGDGARDARRSTARSCPGTTRTWILGWAGAAGLDRRRGLAARPRTSPRADEAFLCSSVAGDPAGDAVRGRADRRRPARAVDARAPARPARRSSAATGDRPTRPMTRDELVRGTRQLIDEGERLVGQPEPRRAEGLAPAHGRPARRAPGARWTATTSPGSRSGGRAPASAAAR